MSDDDELRRKWDARYTDSEGISVALDVLTENAHLLPDSGSALDLACGLGGSALFLAEQGLHTFAWDLSPVAVERLRQRVEGLSLVAEVRDVIAVPPDPESFDVICVGHFLDRARCPQIAAALRPGGLLFYQTFTRERVDASGPSTERFRLDVNELLQLFPELIVRVYREEGRLGDLSRGARNQAQLVAQKAP